MWTLMNLSNGSQYFYLPAGKSYTIGRRDTDVVVAGDQSVSRRHALFTVEEGGRIFVTDHHSKFGTFVCQKKINGGVKIELHCGSTFTLGQGTSTFKVTKQQLMFCCSNMDPTSKQNVRAMVDKLGGVIVSKWSSSCTHLVMNSVTVTVKVVCALASARPIITPRWLESAILCFTEKKVLPPCDSFIPLLEDSNLSDQSLAAVSLVPSESRLTLFKDCTVYFLTHKQYSRLQLCLKSAGGTVKLCTEEDSHCEAICEKKSIVITPDQVQEWMQKIFDQLDRNGLRLIPESEIGYAILHCSQKKFCNPANAADYPQPTPHLIAPTLSQDVPLQPHTYTNITKESVSFTQASQTQTGISILAYNTEKEKQESDVRDLNICSSTRLLEKVDESIVLKQSQPAGEHESMTIQAKIQSVRHIEEERENGTDNSTLLQVGQTSYVHDCDDGRSSFLVSSSLPISPQSIPNNEAITVIFKSKRERKESAQDTLQTLPQPKKSKSSRCCATKHPFSQALPLELLMTCQEQSSPQNIMSSNPVRDIPNEMQNELSVLSQQSLLDDGNHVSGSNPLSTTQNFLSIFSNVPKNQMSQRKPPNLQPILMPTSQKNSSGHDLVKFSVGDNDINFDVVDERERTRKEVISEPHETAGPQYDAVLTEDGFIRTRKRPRKRSIPGGFKKFSCLQAYLMKDQNSQHSACADSEPPMCCVVWTATVHPQVQCIPTSKLDVRVKKNVKKFKKVKNIGFGQSHTRMIAGSQLRVYTGRKIFQPPAEGAPEHTLPHPLQQQNNLF